MITWNTNVNAPGCPGQIVNSESGETVLVQLDWDYPRTARLFGWSTEFVQRCPDCGIVRLKRDDILTKGFPVEWQCPSCHKYHTTPCPHQTTDGSVDCDCGMPACEFIAAASEWLNDNHGATADDPGYFQEA